MPDNLHDAHEQLLYYSQQIETALSEGYAAVKQAVGYIRNHEDGPLTMRAVLRSIKDRLMAVETEVRCMRQSHESLLAMLAQVIAQRDEAIRQCGEVMRELDELREADEDRDGYFYP